MTTSSVEQTVQLGTTLGKKLRGGELFELVSDLGGGKTSFVRGLAEGFGSKDPVASPSFTINYVYSRSDGKQLWHFDFYRLQDGGIVAAELAEAVADSTNVVAVEWGDIVHDVLPKDRIKLHILNQADDGRSLVFEYPKKYEYLFQDLS